MLVQFGLVKDPTAHCSCLFHNSLVGSNYNHQFFHERWFWIFVVIPKCFIFVITSETDPLSHWRAVPVNPPSVTPHM